MPVRIVVVNTRAANIHSVVKALERAGATPVVTDDPAVLRMADSAVLPGVGASDAALRALDEARLREPLRSFAASGRPLLCVCLGMQLLFESSEEGAIPGLGILKGDVRHFPPGMTNERGERLKVPHMGWNDVHISPAGRRHPVLAGVPEGGHFYFVHSYHCVPADTADIAATTDYGMKVCAAVVRGEVVGTQFHPEKSGDLGLQLYENFVRHSGAVAAK